MEKTTTLHDLLAIVPEHPLPEPGVLTALSYPSIDGSVAVDVVTDPSGYAHLTITAPANEVTRSIETARRALVRMSGNDPEKPGAVDRARAAFGAQAFDGNLNLLVRQRLLSLAVMRTGILPFLQPEYPVGDDPVAGKPLKFEATMQLRPSSKLTDYGPVELAFPPKPPVDEKAVDEQISQMLGGAIRWQDVPEEAASGLEKIRGTVREQLATQRDNEWYSSLMTACADELSKRLVTQPALRYIAALRDEMASQYATAIEASGQPWNDYIKKPGFDLGMFKEQMTSEALVALQRGLALDAMAEHEGVRLTEGDVLECLTASAPGHEAEAAQAMIDNGTLPQVIETALRAKTADLVASRAIDTSGK